MKYLRIKSGADDLAFLAEDQVAYIVAQDGQWFVRTKANTIHAVWGRGVDFYDIDYVEHTAWEYSHKAAEKKK